MPVKSEENTHDVIVIGAGISGLSITNMLNPDMKVSLLEKGNDIGGLIRCDRVNGHLFHLVGGHLFNTKNKMVADWFWGHFDIETEFIKATRNAKILLNDKLIGYPIENHLYQLPDEQVQAILQELIEMVKKEVRPDQSTNFETFLKDSFGDTLYNLHFGPYNTKIWHTDLKDIPLEWLDGKLPMPKIADILLSNIIKREDTGMVHATFYYPVNNGSGFIAGRLAQGLDVRLNTQLNAVTYSDGELAINNGDYTTAKLVYCGDVRALRHIINIADPELTDALAAVADLPANGTSNVLCETDDTDLSWLYLPEEKFKAHRIIYTGNFSQTNNDPDARKTCVVEFSGKHEQADMVAELRSLPGNLKPLAFNYEPNSYIIQQRSTRRKITTLKVLLEKYNIYLLGRFAEWEYYNMDKCIESAMTLRDKLLPAAN